MPSIVLIANPYSSGVTPAIVRDVAAALGAHGATVETRTTDGRGHAREIAADASAHADALVVLSGDGTYNEALNGAAGKVPFGFVPGGGASVLPRALGLPRDPVAAAYRVADALAGGHTSRIALGRVNGRLFAFSAGLGLDAEAVRRIDRLGRDHDGRRASNLRFVTTVVRVIAEHRFRMPAQLTVAGHGRAAFLFVANGHPYTYAGPIPVSIAENAEFSAGLDFAAPAEVGPLDVVPLAILAVRGRLGRHKRVLSAHDVDAIDVVCDQPLPLQVDGEDLGDVESARFEAVRDALTVLR